MAAEKITSCPLKKVILGGFALALISGAMFTAGWFAAPDRLLEGYALGNEDGYSVGYLDGLSGTHPNMYRAMTEFDYQARELLGGRKLEGHVGTAAQPDSSQFQVQGVSRETVAGGVDFSASDDDLVGE